MHLTRSRAPAYGEQMADETTTSKSLSRTEAQEGSPNWRLILGRLMLSVKFPDFASALGFVNAVGDIAEVLDHHPDIDLRWGRVVLGIASHDVGGLTSRDLRFTSAIDDIVDEHGGEVEHPRLSQVEIAIDTLDASKIKPFWAAVLGFDEANDEVTDPDSRMPAIWFQQLDEPNDIRNRIHLDISVAHDEAEARIAKALDAGGTLVSDERAPAFWILADADGNEACICTWQDRD